MSGCCPAGSHGPAPGEHGHGRIVAKKDDGFSIYETGKPQKEAIIQVYDIFGTDGGRTKKWADQLAEAGEFLVVVPDFFRAKPWDENNFPPKGGFPELLKFLEDNVPWDKLKADIFENTIPYLRSQGVEKIGIIGFCWGAKQAIQAATDPAISAAVLLHPSFVGVPEIQNAQCPVAILNANNDPPLAPLKEVLDTKPFGPECFLKDYPDSAHGWTVRGDLSNAETARDVKDAFDNTVSFLKKHLKN